MASMDDDGGAEDFDLPREMHVGGADIDDDEVDGTEVGTC